MSVAKVYALKVTRHAIFLNKNKLNDLENQLKKAGIQNCDMKKLKFVF
jgi:hypothetical protein